MVIVRETDSGKWQVVLRISDGASHRSERVLGLFMSRAKAEDVAAKARGTR